MIHLDSFDHQALRAFPVQLIEIQNGIILKRGCTELRIQGEGSTQTVNKVLWMTSTGSFSCQEICEKFGKPQRQLVRNLIGQLLERRILVPREEMDEVIEEPESQLAIFYWNFGASEYSVSKKLNEVGLVILGVNYISRQLVASLLESGACQLKVVDFPLLRNLRLFDQKGKLDHSQWKLENVFPVDYQQWMDRLTQETHSCMVVTSDFGNHEVMRDWNRFCIESNCHFFPIVLQNTIGYIGPFCVPKETACLECLFSRQNANFQNGFLERASEKNSFEGQIVVGIHPSMTSILGNIAALELTKFYSGILPGQNIGSLIEINLLATFMTVRKILKNPRCPACSPLQTFAPLQTRKTSFVLSKEQS